MKKQRYSITEACRDVADSLKSRGDFSPTTIRCAINDTLDAADKDGRAVNFNYNQPRAIKLVRSLIGVA